MPIITPDLYPTLAAIAGAASQASQIIDGESLVPLLRDPAAKLERDAIFWHYPHYHPGGATPHAAVRSRDWKLIEFYEDDHVELYDLGADPEEKNDLAAKQPDKANALRDRLHAWQKSVGAQFATPNPNHDAAKNAAPKKQAKAGAQSRP